MPSRTHGRPLQATLLFASSLTVMSGATIAPSLPQMAEVFAATPDSDFLARLILTVPAFFIALAAPLAGFVVDRFGRLRVLYISLFLYAAAGVSGFFLDSLYHILVGRALLGMAVGGVMTVAGTLVGDYFQGEARQRFIGMQGAFMALGGVVYIGAGGLLADLNWRAPFLVYLLSLLVVPLGLAFLREPERPTPLRHGEAVAAPGLPGAIYLVLATGFVGMLLFYMIPVQLPFLVKSLGVQENWKAAFAIVAATSSGAVASASYRRVRSRFGFAAVYALVFLVMGAGYGLIGLAPAYWMVVVGTFVSGFGTGLMMPNTSTWMLHLAPPALRGRLTGWMASCLFIGQFLSPVFVQPLVRRTSLSFSFVCLGAFMLVLSGIFAFGVRRALSAAAAASA